MKKDDFKKWLPKIPRRRLAAAALTVMTLLLAALAVWGLFAVQHVRKIVIRGESPYTDDEIIAAAGISYGQPLFSTDRSEVREGILNNTPYIREVKVSRRFFSKIVITVKADKPEYCLDVSGDKYILSADMRVLEKVSEQAAAGSGLRLLTLPELYTVKVGAFVEYGSEGRREYVEDMLGYFGSQDYAGDLTEIGLESSYDIYIVLRGRIKIILGNSENMEAKMLVAREILAANPDGSIEYAEINVTNPSAATWRKE